MYDYGKGFNAKYYKDMELAEDPVIFSAKYLMTPVERDGLVFNKDNPSFINTLPGGQPDKIVGYADVTHGGDDFFQFTYWLCVATRYIFEDVLFINKFGGDDNVSLKEVRIIIETWCNKSCRKEQWWRFLCNIN